MKRFIVSSIIVLILFALPVILPVDEIRGEQQITKEEKATVSNI